MSRDDGVATPLLSTVQVEEGGKVVPIDPYALDVSSEGGHAKGTGFFLSSYNLMHAILGSGILGLAFALRSSGFIFFLTVFFFIACVSDYTINLLLRCCDMTGVTSYEDIGRHAFGLRGKAAAALSIMIENIGANTSYLVIVGDLMPDVVKSFLLQTGHADAMDAWYAKREPLMCMLTAFVVFPLASLRRLGFLGYTSGISILLMLFFCVAVLVRYHEMPCGAPGARTIREDVCRVNVSSVTFDALYAFPTMCFSFVCHTTLLPIYTELRSRSRARMQRVAHTSILSSVVIYLIVTIGGYLSFGAGTDSDLLKNYTDTSDSLITTVRLCFVVAICLAVPVIIFPTRKAFDLLFFPGQPFTWLRHMAITVLLVGLALVLALFVPDIKKVFGLVGSTSAVSLLFVLPGLFYLKIAPGPVLSRAKLAPLSMVVLGLVLGCTCFTGLLYKMISS